jgi:hypothetical protein
MEKFGDILQNFCHAHQAWQIAPAVTSAAGAVQATLSASEGRRFSSAMKMTPEIEQSGPGRL